MPDAAAHAPAREVAGLVDLDERGGSPLERLFRLCTPEGEGAYEPERRSLRVGGHCTTLRLERAFWSVLEEISAAEGLSIPELITRIQGHCWHVNDRNLASCLRVLCLRYLSSQAPLEEGRSRASHLSRQGSEGVQMALDTRQLSCPQPILKTKRALRLLEAGDAVRVVTSDRGTAMDLEAFCRVMGYALLGERSEQEGHVLLIRKP